MAMVIRAELFQPGLQFVDPQFFNQMTTMHALVMIFGAVMPAFVGLRELDDPADDRRARHGLAAHEQLELLDPAVRVHCCCPRCSCRAAAPAGGWTLYPPLSLQGGIDYGLPVRSSRCT
jgi:cytochrome c oxidase subunit 1